MADRVVDVELMYVKDHGSSVIIIYSQLLENGSKRLVRKKVKDIGGYYSCLKPKSIKSAEYLEEVYCGIIKNDIRELFIIRLTDGSSELIQVKSCSREHIKLLRICEPNIVDE